jgi:excisionase family DNA binding protein
MSAALDLVEAARPSASDSELARDARQALARLADHNKAVRIDAQEEGEGEGATCVLPARAVRLLRDLLGEMAAGNAVTVTSIPAELSTQQAADLLNVSRPFLIHLLEEGKLPFRKVGTHRRILHTDLMAYKRLEDQARRDVLKELAKQAQELGLGY